MQHIHEINTYIDEILGIFLRSSASNDDKVQIYINRIRQYIELETYNILTEEPTLAQPEVNHLHTRQYNSSTYQCPRDEELMVPIVYSDDVIGFESFLSDHLHEIDTIISASKARHLDHWSNYNELDIPCIEQKIDILTKSLEDNTYLFRELSQILFADIRNINGLIENKANILLKDEEAVKTLNMIRECLSTSSIAMRKLQEIIAADIVRPLYIPENIYHITTGDEDVWVYLVNDPKK